MTFYVLEVEGFGTINKSENNIASTLTNISIDKLLEDNVYNFSIVVFNSVGSLSTDKTKFCKSF